ncbi:MAG: AMP-binding protein [Parvularculaceae bacterium]|nr:AMP-binding protein [Parvularculaceae bacterium]
MERPPSWSWLDAPAPHHRRYAKGGFWRNETIADRAYALADRDPTAAMFLDAGPRADRQGVIADAEALCLSLTELGLRQGDVVSFQVPNWIEAAVINLAAAMGGFIVNPIVPIYRDAEVGMMLADCRAKALFLSPSFRNYDYGAMIERLRPSLPALRHVVFVRGRRDGALAFDDLVNAGARRGFSRPAVDPGGVKMLLYTSGTTGRPKGVLHSHNTIARAVECCVRHWSIRPGDAIIMPSPVTHISGYSNGLELPLLAETRTVLMESWNAREAISLIERHEVAGTVAATPFLVELANAARLAGTRLPSLRFFACGGAAVPPDVIPSANAAFERCRAFRVFGASEVPLVTLGFPAAADERLAATTDGRIVDYDVRIVDNADRDVAPGEEGEILARGPAMFLGYADEKQTQEAVTAEGYFRTGDLGRVTPEGAVVITGRKKDLIIRGGENISAKEIEDVLHVHPTVAEAAIVAMPHPRLGEGICAYVIIKRGATADAKALGDHVAASGLARQKIPERFEFVSDFPRTASGKIRKDQLRAQIKATIEADQR